MVVPPTFMADLFEHIDEEAELGNRRIRFPVREYGDDFSMFMDQVVSILTLWGADNVSFNPVTQDLTFKLPPSDDESSTNSSDSQATLYSDDEM